MIWQIFNINLRSVKKLVKWQQQYERPLWFDAFLTSTINPRLVHKSLETKIDKKENLEKWQHSNLDGVHKIPFPEEVHVTFSGNKNNVVMITLISVILILLTGHVQQKQMQYILCKYNCGVSVFILTTVTIISTNRNTAL